MPHVVGEGARNGRQRGALGGALGRGHDRGGRSASVACYAALSRNLVCVRIFTHVAAQYLVWRVWYMRRKKAAVEAAEAAEAAESELERESAFTEADEGPLSPGRASARTSQAGAAPGEGLPTGLVSPTPPTTPRRVGSPPGLAPLPATEPEVTRAGPPLYLVMVSFHGLVRGEEMEVREILLQEKEGGATENFVFEFATHCASSPSSAATRTRAAK